MNMLTLVYKETEREGQTETSNARTAGKTCS